MLISFVFSFLLVFLAYLFGSIPTGYLAGKWLKGIDIRQVGSGSTGATNVLRNLGKPAAIAVLGIDVLKGMAAVGLVRGFYEFASTELIPIEWKYWLIFFTGIAAILGHSKSIFLNFTGGKSVATSLGVLAVMNPLVALGAFGSFLVMLAISRIVSLSSITAAIAVTVLMVALKQPLPYLIFGVIGGIYVIVRHSGNIQRLLAGTEPKIGQKSPATIETESSLPNT